MLFCFCMCKISDAICLLVSFLHFVACFHMCRGKLFVHLFACRFNFCDCRCICLLTLFFVVFLWCVSLFFFATLIKFQYLVFLQVRHATTSLFAQLRFIAGSFFFVYRLTFSYILCLIYFGLPYCQVCSAIFDSFRACLNLFVN